MDYKDIIMFWDDGGDPPIEPVVDGDGEGKKKKETPAEKAFSEAEMQKAIDRRQAALKRARKAEDDLKAQREKIKNMPSADEYDDLQKNYKAMLEKMQTLEEKQAEEEIKAIENEIERERAKLNQGFDRERAKLNADLKKMQDEVNLYKEEKALFDQSLQVMRKDSLKGSILAAASKKAYNPQQVVQLTVGEFVYDEADGRWIKEVYDSAGKLKELLSVDDYINSFLDDELNENLLKAGVKSGSDMPRTQKTSRKDTDPPAGQVPTELMYKWADMSGLNINKKSSADDKAWLYNTYMKLHNKEVKKAE
jgi:hypothetical protein